MESQSVEEESMFHGQSVEESIQQSELQNLTAPSLQFEQPSKPERKMDVAEINPSKSKQKSISPLAIGLIVLSLLLAIIAIAMIIAYATYDDGVCKTPACVNAASRIMNNMDTTKEPCTDFYRYACGGWLKKNIIPDGFPRYSTIDMITALRMVTLKNALEKRNDSDTSAIKKTKTFYKSCVDESTKNLLKAQPLINTFPNMFDWPVTMDNWDTVYGAAWTADKAMINLNVKFASSSLIYVTISRDLKNSTVRNLYIDQPALGLPSKEYYACTESYAQACSVYMDYMITLATLIRTERNLTVDNNQIKTEMERVFQLEKAVANALIPESIKSDTSKVYNKMTVAQVEKDYVVVINGNKLNWLSFLNGLIAPAGITITADEPVIMFASEYILNITSALSGFNSRDIQNYLAWHYVRSVVGSLSKEYTDASKLLRQILYGSSGEEPVWKSCVSYFSDNFDDVLGRLYVEEAFPGDSKDKVKAMISEIRKMFMEMLNEQTWMDEETKQKALLKASKIKEQIGFPDFIFNDAKLDGTYAAFEFKINEYFDNVREYTEYGQIERAKRLKQSADPNDWQTGASEINAAYSPSDNQIVLPAGILQPPFFSSSDPKSLTYGGIGTVIGHEITHGFDDTGKNYDENGNLVNWWTDVSLKKFSDLSQCFINQYGNFSWSLAGGNKLSGIGTLSENIADNGGLREAYMAYKDYLKNNGREKQLPGIDFTNEQLFFIGFGQIWCSSYTPEYAVISISQDEHSPGEFRVIGTLQNVPEFSEAFSCKSTDYMNPKQKCRVW